MSDNIYKIMSLAIPIMIFVVEVIINYKSKKADSNNKYPSSVAIAKDYSDNVIKINSDNNINIYANENKSSSNSDISGFIFLIAILGFLFGYMMIGFIVQYFNILQLSYVVITSLLFLLIKHKYKSYKYKYLYIYAIVLFIVYIFNLFLIGSKFEVIDDLLSFLNNKPNFLEIANSEYFIFVETIFLVIIHEAFSTLLLFTFLIKKNQSQQDFYKELKSRLLFCVLFPAFLCLISEILTLLKKQ